MSNSAIARLRAMSDEMMDMVKNEEISNEQVPWLIHVATLCRNVAKNEEAKGK